jgi:membrane protease YdiL (CAAX protease family)
MLVMLAGTIPRNLIFAANLRLVPSMPWAVPVTAVYLWFFWRYVGGAGPPRSTTQARRRSLRANRVALKTWVWSLIAGALGIIALVIFLRLVNRVVALPQQRLPDLSHVPKFTVLCLLLMAAPVAGVVEEAAFRGYMQGPIERRYGPALAILVTGVMFAAAHLDFTPILLPYYIAVAAIYGFVTYFADSIVPAIVLHTGGNLYSNFHLWLYGEAEWQTPGMTRQLIWQTGIDRHFWVEATVFVIVALAAAGSFMQLARVKCHVSTIQGRTA